MNIQQRIEELKRKQQACNIPDQATFTQRDHRIAIAEWMRAREYDAIPLLEDCLREIERKDAEIEAARLYLARLLHHNWPELNILPDLDGVCTQIDNAYAVGYRILKERIAELEAKEKRNG